MNEEKTIREDEFDLEPEDPQKEAESLAKINKSAHLASAAIKSASVGDRDKAKELHRQAVMEFPKDFYLYQDKKETILARKLILRANQMIYRKEESLVIDLNQFKTLNEFSVLSMMGGWIEILLGRMFGGSSIPVTIKGPKRSVEAFGKALGAEKRYIEALRKYGLDNPESFKSKSDLDKAVSKFQRETGILWPFDD